MKIYFTYLLHQIWKNPQKYNFYDFFHVKCVILEDNAKITE